MSETSERCPGGYLVRGTRLCGHSGNQCVGRCAFHYLAGADKAPESRTPPHETGAVASETSA